MSRRRTPVSAQPDPRWLAFSAGLELLERHGLFRGMRAPSWATVPALDASRGLGRVDTAGLDVCHARATLEPAEWAWVVAHLWLHRALGHIAPDRHHDEAGDAAACLEVNRFLREAHLGTEPFPLPAELPRGDVDGLAERWRTDGVPAQFRHSGTAGSARDIVVVPLEGFQPPDWPAMFAASIARSATEAVEAAGGARASTVDNRNTVWERARRWFVSSYPLLGALAARFTIVADVTLAQQWRISVAAVHAGAGEIYVNPAAGLTEAEWRFVLAHEMLHAALRHGDRAGARDPYLWNVAADFVINGWLAQMRVGDMPEGVLFDQSLDGLSAEAVYDTIAVDVRRLRRLATLRGKGLGDVLGEPLGPVRPYVDLDEYCRRALSTGLAYHESGGRGHLPAGLVAEIRALNHPPLPWDAKLAQWFAEYVRMPEPHRSYARPSRRQSASPDIPRPGWRFPEEAVPRCTFGVLLDTSGSMNHRLLGLALGAIASYATARDVPRARVVFCDAAPYDAGYLAVDDIAGRVTVRGRGGTELQPGIRLLERADDFPPDAPILVITDGQCDVLRIRREHAFLIPEGARLPFTPRGPVFHLSPV